MRRYAQGADYQFAEVFISAIHLVPVDRMLNYPQVHIMSFLIMLQASLLHVVLKRSVSAW